LIEVRGDPFIPAVEEGDIIADENDLNDEDYTRRNLIEVPSFENVTDADDLISLIINYFDPKETVIYEPVNAITTFVKISPNITKMEAIVTEKFVPDASNYLETLTSYSAETIAEAERIRQYQIDNPF